MGRDGFFDEVMRFYDQFLKGEKPAVTGPADRRPDQRRQVALGGQPGRRADAKTLHQRAEAGTYTDDGRAAATGPGAEKGVWTISPPLKLDAHAVGLGQRSSSTSVPGAPSDLVVDVYDLDKNGTGPLITRQGHLIRENGPIVAATLVGRLEDQGGPPHRRKVADANYDW